MQRRTALALAHLHRIDPEHKMARFYCIDVAATLFGDVSVLRTWGRIGTHGRTRLETCATVEAAESAVKKVFAILGADIDRPESVEEFRADLRFGRKLRKIADHGMLAFFAVAAAALAAAVWSGIASKLGGH